MRRNYNFAFLDEGSKREIRRAALKAVAIPGYQVPFASREMPIGRGWGTGGLQLTLSPHSRVPAHARPAARAAGPHA